MLKKEKEFSVKMCLENHDLPTPCPDDDSRHQHDKESQGTWVPQ